MKKEEQLKQNLADVTLENKEEAILALKATTQCENEQQCYNAMKQIKNLLLFSGGISYKLQEQNNKIEQIQDVDKMNNIFYK